MQQGNGRVKIRCKWAALDMRIGVTHSVELERGNMLVFDQLDDLIVKVFKIVRPRQRQLAVYGFETILFCMRDANIARLVVTAPR